MRSEVDKSWEIAAANNVTSKIYSAWHGVNILCDEQSLAEICVYVQVVTMTET